MTTSPASRPASTGAVSRADEPESKDPMDSLAAQAATNPLGAGLGAAGGAAVGAAAGIAAGPVGSLAGAVLGTIAGALAGGTAESSWHETSSSDHWRRLYNSRPYMTEGARFEDWGPAYAYGEAMYERQSGPRRWDDGVESELGHGWEAERASSGSALGWNQARHAARDAWERLHDNADNDPTRPGRDIAG
ncbi:hypothetical protein [Azohydromonas caseinilytica]|uniref:Glycine zipper domain-containing protein n=1 Tax=Azohydromonas caseinilytica TaxID=2728836 RepID=A0A848F3Y6_9BURK|nr:hypothetical protein [Azohydromonas caseinilytica]NML14797.1 hypothetical protein [Azohydromonas caseinilytica]